MTKKKTKKKESHSTGGGKWADKVFKENTTPCGWRFFSKPVGLELEGPIVTTYICYLFYSFGITFFTYSLICKMLIWLFNSFGEI
ncbi:hypothetical protein [Mesoflavibacter sp. CH_XMU1422-2]|uniref:hypothetical protein n=1 Tax=Mesoflavibacter sp. CH_XMU1422-2 TaxID=3107770 RepID=UPI00300A32B2